MLHGSASSASGAREARLNGGHPYIVPAQIFPTRDGHMALFISRDGLLSH
jgi:CoA:oxalate CoA-transferase